MKSPRFLGEIRRPILPLALIAMCVTIGLLNPAFLTTTNLLNILEQTTMMAIIAAGMTFVIVLGGIDLSVGSIVGLCGIALGTLVSAGVPDAFASVLVLVIGGMCGAMNGVLIGYGRVPPFVATLAMLGCARGLALLLSNGRSISGFDRGIIAMATGSVLGLPIPVLLMFLVFVASGVLLRLTPWGIRIYAIGGNARAAWLSGLKITWYQIAVYALSGTLSALAALVLTARLAAALPTAGTGYELDAIAAVVIGGASLSGGRGSVWGTLLGALILAVLENGLTILNVSSYFQQILSGAIIVLAVLIDQSRWKGVVNAF